MTQDAACDEDFVSVVQRVCTADPLAPVLERQFLFNIISHPAVEFEGMCPQSWNWGIVKDVYKNC